MIERGSIVAGERRRNPEILADLRDSELIAIEIDRAAYRIRLIFQGRDRLGAVMELVSDAVAVYRIDSVQTFCIAVSVRLFLLTIITEDGLRYISCWARSDSNGSVIGR